MVVAMGWLAAPLRGRLRRIAATRDRGFSTAQVTVLTPLLIMVLLLIVLCGRLVNEQMALDEAASAAARAAALARTDPAAHQQATSTATSMLVAQGVSCQQTTVDVSTGGLHPGGVVTVHVVCRLRLADLVLLGIPGSRVVQSQATAMVDVWRGAS
jgi:Flp pilus assembly protein TadG